MDVSRPFKSKTFRGGNLLGPAFVCEQESRDPAGAIKAAIWVRNSVYRMVGGAEMIHDTRVRRKSDVAWQVSFLTER